MFVVTFDQRGATGGDDRVPELLAALSACTTRLPPERTSGDEAQVLTDRAEAALDLVRVALELGEWSVGLGIGTVALPLPASVREARGDAENARDDGDLGEAENLPQPVGRLFHGVLDPVEDDVVEGPEQASDEE